MESTFKFLSLVEATTINAVAKNVFEFSRSARELNEKTRDFPAIDDLIVTFRRQRPNDQISNEFVRSAGELGLHFQVIPERRRFDLTVIPALRRIVEETTPQLIVTHSVKSHFLLWRSRLWQRYPWIAFHHGYTTTDRKMRVYNHLDRWSLPKADRLVTVCNAFARELAGTTRVPIEKIAVRHNSVRPQPPPAAEAVQNLRTSLGIADHERVVLAVGRLSREKAQIDLISAFKLMRDNNPQLKSKVVIVGDGPERATLAAAVRSCGFEKDVVFAGQQSEVRPYYAMAEVFVLPSHSEGSPNVLLEAMAAGVAIVATTVGGVPEMIEDNQSALLVPANNPSGLSAAISRLLTDDDLAGRLTSKASALVVNRFSPEEYVRSLMKIYRGVAQREKIAS